MKRLIWGFACDAGRVRENTDDAVFTMGIVLSDVNLTHLGLFIVADGLGAGIGGAHASNLAVNTIARHLVQSLFTPLIAGEASPEIPTAITAAVRAAHNAITGSNRRDPARSGTSTIDVAFVMGDSVNIGHVGDSRAYLITEGDIRLLTGSGEVNEEGARQQPADRGGNRALGQPENLELDTLAAQFEGQSSILLCTDGVSRMLSSDVIAEVVRSAAGPQQACELITRANDHGGEDNAAAVLFSYR